MTNPIYSGLIQELMIKNRYATQSDAVDAEPYNPGARIVSERQLATYPDYDGELDASVFPNVVTS